MKHLLTLEPFERHPGRVFAVIGLVFAIAYVTALTAFPRNQGRIINGDSIQYYAYLRSLIIDRDVDFTNDYQLLYSPVDSTVSETNMWLTNRTAAGRPENMMSIGPALLWVPFFLAASALVILLRPFGIVVPFDGIAAPFALSAGVGGIFCATLGAYLCYRACRLTFSNGPAFWGVLVAWLASPAIYYSIVSPAYSHASSLFATALFCYVWLKTRGDEGVLRYLGLGVLAGLAALVRWQDVVIVVLPAAELLHSVARRRASLLASLFRAAEMSVGVAIMLIPQLLAWRAIYGHLLLMPQGEGFMHWTSPALVSVLFSLRHGLFSWTPAVLVGVVGFYALVRRDPLLGWPAVVVFLLAVYVNGSVNDWWAGEAFGARRFVGYTVFFALGLSAVFSGSFWQRRPMLLRWVAVALVVYNVLFLLQYQLFMRGYRHLAPYPTTMQQVLFDRLVLPWHLARIWLGG